MPFVRFSRDKRGYEHTYLIHAAQKKGAPARVLYWYRTPPGVRGGRPAFDDEVRRALEGQYPHIDFDWPSLLSTTIPPVEVEHWRERRRAEKAAKQARQAAVRDDGLEDEEPPSDDGAADADGDATSPAEPAAHGPSASFSEGRARRPPPAPFRTAESEQTRGPSNSTDAVGIAGPDEGPDRSAEAEDGTDGTEGAEGESSEPGPPGEGSVQLIADQGAGAPNSVRKRRRRGGRRRRRGPAPSPEPATPPGGSEPSE